MDDLMKAFLSVLVVGVGFLIYLAPSLIISSSIDTLKDEILAELRRKKEDK